MENNNIINNINKNIYNIENNNSKFYYYWSYNFINNFEIYIEKSTGNLIELLIDYIVEYNKEYTYKNICWKKTTISEEIEYLNYINNNIVNNSKLSIEEKNKEFINYFNNKFLIKV